MNELITLGEFVIKKQADFPYAKGELSRLLSAIRLAAKVLNSQLNKAGLVGSLMGKAGATNIQGEEQQKLDLYANQLFIKALSARNEVCGIASEEEDEAIILDNKTGRNGKYVVMIDPVDGSSNIEVNVSVGTVFAIYRRDSPIGSAPVISDFLQPGRKQVVAGYVIFGSSTMLVFTSGNGVNGFTYDPAIGVFFLSHPNMKIPENGKTYSINEGNDAYFSDEMKAYLSHCKSVDEASNRPYTSRYIGSMISDVHRTLLKGGIYMYPNSSKAEKGKLRLCYECNPMALLIEQAGGKSSNGFQSILDLKPTHIHERTPFFTGSKKMVEELEAILKKKAT